MRPYAFRCVTRANLFRGREAVSDCSARTRKGHPCRFPARRGTERCINHEDGNDTRSAAARAGRGNAPPHTPAIQLLEAAFSLTDRAAIQAVLDTVLRLTLGGRITPERARIAVRICSAAARNFDGVGDTLEGPKSAAHDWAAYFGRLRSVLSSIDPLIAEGNATDAASNQQGDFE